MIFYISSNLKQKFNAFAELIIKKMPFRFIAKILLVFIGGKVFFAVLY
jgi:hypothetical protein